MTCISYLKNFLFFSLQPCNVLWLKLVCGSNVLIAVVGAGKAVATVAPRAQARRASGREDRCSQPVLPFLLALGLLKITYNKAT